MTEQSRSSSAQSRRRRFSEVDNSFGDHYHFRSRVPFKSFDDRLQESRLLFSETVPTIGVTLAVIIMTRPLTGITFFVSEVLWFRVL
ncbi:hypothetical protein Bca52824_039692 [Brassica carinata]|uniref:Uncharacterized protein n=1 Tax=Brassica carinata TaxID=52824 RepID=A0A8X7RS39_BRACI|nr:hypothetical protein Bca52824_039692 [Brassica carinata]